ncbi:DgyrCDS2687 [Dimorphilus gyrociliatus]|uniref:DgyrCDS2687 n=1 Tax=Dimorphilus gyrociliatus TaxID=2664684 RepID=A0A7I8VB11_9ANNE|nr:DgyrCDS2687 [Dimorphilus gyrociliatus]
MSRWFQYMVGVIHIDWKPTTGKQASLSNSELALNVKLGYRDERTNWTVMAQSTEKRSLDCVKEKDYYECDIIPLYEIGSVHHDFYLLNLMYNTTKVRDLQIDSIYLHVILQTGGFTRVWLSLKTVTFPLIIGLVIFFWNRIRKLSRSANLLEKIIFGMGLTLAFLDCPIEWLTLGMKIPFMLLLNDIRQGIFYCALLSFWIVFCGEHMMDKVIRNRVSVYWKELTAVGIGSLCLFIFEICERGVQLTNPFFTIWADNIGKRVAVKEGNWKWGTGSWHASEDDDSENLDLDETQPLEYTSAFFTGVFCMWNIYAGSLLFLYAPSKKNPNLPEDEQSDERGEEIEFSQINSEAVALAPRSRENDGQNSFLSTLQKSAMD